MARLLVGVALAGLAVGLFASSAPSRTACDASRAKVVGRADFDGDGKREPLVEEHRSGCPHNAGTGTYAAIRKRVREYVIAGPYFRLGRARIVEADGRDHRREAFTVLCGVAARESFASIVHLVRRRGRRMLRLLHYLFAYRPGDDVKDFRIRLPIWRRSEVLRSGSRSVYATGRSASVYFGSPAAGVFTWSTRQAPRP